MNFYDNFINECKRVGIKPSPLLQKLKIGTGGLSRWRSGSEPTTDIAKKIAEALNVSVDYLIRDNETITEIDPKEKITADINEKISIISEEFEELKNLMHQLESLS